MAVTRHEMPDCLPFASEELVLGRVLGNTTGSNKGQVYEVWTTNPEHSAAMEGIKRNQNEFASHHHSVCPNLHMSYIDWLSTLSCGSVKDYIKKGVVVLRAVVIHEKHKVDVVGYISGDGKGAHLHLNHFVVMPQHRGLGVGRLLFDAFLKFFGTSREIKLEVYLGNEAAFATYSRWGFQSVKATKRLTHMKLGKGIRGAKLDKDIVQRVTDANHLLDAVKLLAAHTCGLHCAVRSLVRQLTQLSSEADGMISDRFVGCWSIEDCRGSWGKAHVGPLNVGWMQPVNADLTMRELRIHGVGTERKPFRLNAAHEATVVEQDDRKITWELKAGGRVTWTLEDRNNLVPDMECQFALPYLNHPRYLHAIHHLIDKLSVARRELKGILRKNNLQAQITFSLKARTDALTSILDALDKQLSNLHTQYQRKRKAELVLD